MYEIIHHIRLGICINFLLYQNCEAQYLEQLDLKQSVIMLILLL